MPTVTESQKKRDRGTPWIFASGCGVLLLGLVVSFEFDAIAGLLIFAIGAGVTFAGWAWMHGPKVRRSTAATAVNERDEEQERGGWALDTTGKVLAVILALLLGGGAYYFLGFTAGTETDREAGAEVPVELEGEIVDLPFLKWNEVGMNALIRNTGNTVVLLKGFEADEQGNYKFTYGPWFDHAYAELGNASIAFLELEDRYSDEQRWDSRTMGTVTKTLEEFIALRPGQAFRKKLILTARSDLREASAIVIELEVHVTDTGHPAESLKLWEDGFRRKHVDGSAYRDLPSTLVTRELRLPL